MRKNVYKQLEALTGEPAGFNYSKLASRYAEAITATREEDERKAIAYRLNDKDLSEYEYSWISKVVANELDKEVDRVDGTLPISTVFEVFQSVKAASKSNSRDIGLRVLTTHLEKLWKRDKSANLTVNDFLRIKEHYERNYPKSACCEVIDDATQKGYLTLPVGELIDLTANIRSQEDYDYYIKEAGLSGNNPFQRKARKFILALLNGEKHAEDLMMEDLGFGDDDFAFLDEGMGEESSEAMGGSVHEEVMGLLEQLKTVHPEAYEQLMMPAMGHSVLPSYAMEDPSDEFWASEEAKSILQVLKDALV